MTHRWHDLYHHQQTPAHHLDPRTKLLSGLLFVFSIVLSSSFSRRQVIAYGVLILLCLSAARLPFGAFLRRLVVVLPFLLTLALSWVWGTLPHERLNMILAKSLLSVAALAVMSLTTPFPDLLRAMERLHVPRLVTLILVFVYRYVSVLLEDIEKIEKAWASRYFGRQLARQWGVLGHILAAFFIRSYERAERVYAAMQSRGFSGQARWSAVIHFSGWDLVFFVMLAGALGFIRWRI